MRDSSRQLAWVYCRWMNILLVASWKWGISDGGLGKMKRRSNAELDKVAS